MKCINVKPMSGNTVAPELELNKEYELIDTFICKCGEKHFNVGLPMVLNWVECYKCRQDLPRINHYCHSSRFE